MHPRVRDLLELNKTMPEQRTPPWYAMRNDMVTASDVGTILGTNKYSSKTSVLNSKLGLTPSFTGNAATQWGNDNEDKVRDMFCDQYGKICHDVGLLPHPKVSWLGASPDGLLDDGALLEIKCPTRRIPQEGVIPPHYMSQIQLQLSVVDLDLCYFVEWMPVENEEDIFLVQEVKRDPSWFEDNIGALTEFRETIISYNNDTAKFEEYRERYEEKKRKRQLTKTFRNVNLETPKIQLSTFIDDLPQEEGTQEKKDVPASQRPTSKTTNRLRFVEYD